MKTIKDPTEVWQIAAIPTKWQPRSLVSFYIPESKFFIREVQNWNIKCAISCKQTKSEYKGWPRSDR